MRWSFSKTPKSSHLGDYWPVESIEEEWRIVTSNSHGFLLELNGFDRSHLSLFQEKETARSLHELVKLDALEKLHLYFHRRVDFESWSDEQLNQIFATENKYARRLLLYRLKDHFNAMSREKPMLLSQSIQLYYECPKTSYINLEKKQQQLRQILHSSDIGSRLLKADEIERKIVEAADFGSHISREAEMQWPSVDIHPSGLSIGRDQFRALRLEELPEDLSEFGMIEALSLLPLSLNISLHLEGMDSKQIVKNLEKKRNILHAKSENASNADASVNLQVKEINGILESLAEASERPLQLSMTLGVRAPLDSNELLQQSVGTVIQSANRMGGSQLQETTLDTFDAFLSGLPTFQPKHLKSHTVLSSNASHFLPVFKPSEGDRRGILNFRSRRSSLFRIDPVDSSVANYNWLVSGTSGSGKSFLVNSVLFQSTKLNPQIFIIDVGGSYNRLTEFLGGEVHSLDPQIGFQLSPFFEPQSRDAAEETLRKEHIFNVFLEMTRLNGELPSIEVRDLLREELAVSLKRESLPEHPIRDLYHRLEKMESDGAAKRLRLLLKPWTVGHFAGSFLDNNKGLNPKAISTFDLKGLTDFPDLARVVQLLLSSLLWSKVRQNRDQFSWIVLDEVAFSLLKTQGAFVDELISTLRKYYGGVIVVVQDLEKVTSSAAAGSILQNTHTKCLFQQRGDIRNLSDPLDFDERDLQQLESLRRRKGVFSDFLLLRDQKRHILRHMPDALEYWLATTAPEDQNELEKNLPHQKGDSFSERLLHFVERKKVAA